MSTSARESPDKATRFSKERQPKSRARPKAVGAGKLQLVTLSDLDQRTLAAKRAHQLVEAMTRDLGADQDKHPLSANMQQLVQAAAVLGAMIESDQASWLSGDKIDVSSFLAALNSQRRLLLTLGLERRAKDVSTLRLKEYLQQEHRDAEHARIDADVVQHAADEGVEV